MNAKYRITKVITAAVLLTIISFPIMKHLYDLVTFLVSTEYFWWRNCSSDWTTRIGRESLSPIITISYAWQVEPFQNLACIIYNLFYLLKAPLQLKF